MKKYLFLLVALIVSVCGMRAEVVTTYSTAGTPMTHSELLALSGENVHFGLMAVSENTATYKKWFGFNSATSRVNTLTTAQLFTLSGETDNYTFTRVSDSSTPATGVKVVNRKGGDYAAEYTDAMQISIDNQSNQHFNANSYAYAAGTGGWSAYVAYGPYYVAEVSYELNGATQSTATHIVKANTEIDVVPAGYVLVSSPTVTADGNYTVVIAENSVTYHVTVTGAAGSLNYDGTTYEDGQDITVSYLDESLLSATTVAGKVGTVTVTGDQITVTYTDEPTYITDPSLIQSGAKYSLKLVGTDLYLNLVQHDTKGTVLGSSPEALTFTAVSGGFQITNDGGKYVGGHSNTWNMSSSIAETWTVEAATGGLVLHCSRGYVGFDGTPAVGGAAYRDKGTSARAVFEVELVSPAPASATVTYVYKYNGSEFDRTETTQVIGNTIAAPTAKAFMTLSYDATLEVVEGGVTVEVTCTDNLPFTVTTNPSAPVTGLFHMHSNQNYLAYMDTEANRGKWTAIGSMPVDIPQQYYWYIMGNLVDGFQVYNLATGMPIMATEGQGYIASDDDATADVNNLWHIVAGTAGSKYSTGIFALKTDVNVTDKPYLNARSSGMGFWNAADNGSSFQFEPATYVAPTTHDYTVHFVGAPEGTTVSYDSHDYVEGDVITIDGTPVVGDFTAETLAGYNSSVAIDKDALTVTVTYTAWPTYTVHFVGAPEGTTVSYDSHDYVEGETITINGVPAVGDFTAETIVGYSSEVVVDADALTVTVTYSEIPSYSINFTNAPHSHSSGGRVVSAIKLGDQSITINGAGNFYQDLTASESFTVDAGATVKPAIIWNGTWMHGLVYLDTDASDFQFTESELVSNTALSGAPNLATGFSEFTVPSTPGDYRMRYKVDWASKDPGGASDLCANGGYILDVMLHVVAVTDKDYTVHFVDAPEGANVVYGEVDYEEGDVITISGTPVASDFQPASFEYYTSSIEFDTENLIVTITYVDHHPRVLATLKSLAETATNESLPTVSAEWNSTETEGHVYSFNGTDQYLGAESEDVANAFKGDGIVTVAAWVYGNASTGCLFGNGQDGKGVKFRMQGTTFSATTWGVADLPTQNVANMQADQWNLVAFAFPGKASGVNNFRYYTSATDGQLWTKTINNNQRMNDPVGNFCAVGSGYGAQWKEGFNGMISNLVVIESGEFLTNSQIADFVGAQPTEVVAEEVDVTYNIYVDGTLVDTQVKQEKVGFATKFTLSAPSYVTVTGIPATVEATTVDVITTTDFSQLPFVPGADHFYTMKEKRNATGLSIYVDPADETSLKTVQGPTVNVENQNYFQWSFVGNWYTGFALLNKQTQSYVTYNSVNPAQNYHAVLTDTPAEGAYFDLVQNGGENYLKIHGTTVDAYISNYGGVGTTFLTNWNSTGNIGDNGAKIAIEEAVQLTYADLYVAALNAAQTELTGAANIPALYSTQAIADAQTAAEAITFDGNDQASVEQAISDLEGVMDTFRATAVGSQVAFLSKSSFSTRGADYYLTAGNTNSDRMTAELTMQPGSVFVVESYDTESNGYTVKSLFTENYLPTLGNGGNAIYTNATASHYTFAAQGEEENRVIFQNTESPVSDSRGGLHIDAQKKIVVWGASGLATQWVLMPVTDADYNDLLNLDVTISQVGYTTLYCDYALEVPEGVKAYAVTFNEETGNLTPAEITEGEIPANTGVVLKGDASTTAKFTRVATTEVSASSDLQGVCQAANAANYGDNIYVLSATKVGEGVYGNVGFYKFVGSLLAAYKAFFIPSNGAEVRSFALDFGTEGIIDITTGERVEGSFDLQGRYMGKNVKSGLYIMNGKKTLKK